MRLKTILFILLYYINIACFIQIGLDTLFQGNSSFVEQSLHWPFSIDLMKVDSGADGLSGSMLVPATPLVAGKEEAKAVLTSFLKEQGFSKAVSEKTINNSDLFIDHLVSRLPFVHESQYLVGRELATTEMRDALIPYLKSLLEEHRNILDLAESFPNPPDKEKPVEPVSPPNLTFDYKKLKAVVRVGETGPAGLLPPSILYLIELGMGHEQIKKIASGFPAFAYYSLEGKIKPLVEFLLDLGVAKSDIPTIIMKRPQLCGYSLSGSLIPTMRFLENFGVNKKRLAKLICNVPSILTHSKQKVQVTINFLYEMGIPRESIGKILTRCPHFMSYSVEDKLHPTTECFRSLGVDIALLLHQCPHTFALSIEANLKPMTNFFLERGFSVEEIRTMISKFGAVYCFSVEENLIPKWKYFLTMDYSKEDLVKFPQYFGYSLEGRIKPRYALVKESGVKFGLNRMLSLSKHDFDEVLKKKKKKVIYYKASSGTNRRGYLQPGS